MVAKYVRVLTERAINPSTNSIWAIQDVPTLWRNKVKTEILNQGYDFDEDGTVIKKEN